MLALRDHEQFLIATFCLLQAAASRVSHFVFYTYDAFIYFSY